MTNIDERALFSVINTEFLDLSHNLLYSVNLSKLRNLHFVNITHNRFTNVPSFKDESGDSVKFSPKLNFNLTLTRPLRRTLRMRWFFDVSKVNESSFFKSNVTDPPQIFAPHLFENSNLSSSSFHFSVTLLIKILF